MLKILSLIPARTLAKFLPEIISFVLTKALTWVAKKYPHKLQIVVDKVNDFTTALTVINNATADNKITVQEVEEFSKEMKGLFR